MNANPRYNPDIHHRRSIRLPGYDYAQEGSYFITLCVHNRVCLFGKIVDGEIQLNEYGEIVRDLWLETPTIRPNVELSEWVIMPNHFHAILTINRRGGGGVCKGVLQYAPTAPTTTLQSPSQTIGAIVRGFKSAVTKRINQTPATPGVPVWQRNYWDHVIRDEQSYHDIAAYIVNNPTKWETDKLYSGGNP